MIDDFDELFDKFFNDKGDKNKSKKIRSLIDRLNSFDDVNPTRFNPDENELGEPDEVETYENKGHTFKRSTWNLKEGSIVKIEILESNNYEKNLFRFRCSVYGFWCRNVHGSLA